MCAIIVIFVIVIIITTILEQKKIAIELNSIDMLKHILFKDYIFPNELADLNLTQERILMTVKNSGQLPMVTIARAIGLEKGPFSQTVDKLEELSLLVRVRSTQDKRLIYLGLTDKGSAITSIIEESMEKHFSGKIEMLSTIEKEAFFQALEVLKNTANNLISK